MTELKMLDLGQILVFTRDQGVNYMTERLVKVIQPFNLNAVRDEWENLHAEWKNCHFRGRVTRVREGGLDFTSYLLNKGLVEKIKCIEIQESFRGVVCYD